MFPVKHHFTAQSILVAPQTQDIPDYIDSKPPQQKYEVKNSGVGLTLWHWYTLDSCEVIDIFSLLDDFVDSTKRFHLKCSNCSFCDGGTDCPLTVLLTIRASAEAGAHPHQSSEVEFPLSLHSLCIFSEIYIFSSQNIFFTFSPSL